MWLISLYYVVHSIGNTPSCMPRPFLKHGIQERIGSRIERFTRNPILQQHQSFP